MNKGAYNVRSIDPSRLLRWADILAATCKDALWWHVDGILTVGVQWHAHAYVAQPHAQDAFPLQPALDC